ncbi:MAG: glycosyltransferase [Sutterella wadsworthensis]|nr:glycosyltransferase [Sutterella wadsworthensis]
MKKHIVLLTTWRVISSVGGTEKVLCDMANALSERNYNVTIIYFEQKQGKPGFPLNKSVTLINVLNIFPSKSVSLNFFEKLKCFSLDKIKQKESRYALRSQKLSKALEAILQNLQKVDLFISFTPESSYLLSKIVNGDTPHTPVITMYHFTPEKFVGEWDYETFYKHAVSKSDIVQVLMPEYIQIAQRLHPTTKIICISNVAPFQGGNSQPHITSKKIINIARIAEQKRPELLIRAFAIIKDKYPDWICEWWGEITVEPSLTNQIQKLIDELQLHNRFFLRGTTKNSKNELCTASIFAFPSKFEGQSLSLLEAMSIGLPTIGCLDCPSVNTIIRDHENGILSLPNPESYAVALEELMFNKEMRIRLGNQAKIDMQQYSPEKI